MEPPGDDAVVRTLEPLLEGKREPARQRCANCDAELSGSFCSHCGQKAGSLEITLREFAREALDSVFSFDSRLWRTLKPLLLRPGLLTVEYWQGRRARYMPPLRMYLFVSFLTFLTLGLLHAVRPEVGIPMVRTSGDLTPAGAVEGEAIRPGDVEWEERTADESAFVRWLLLEVVRPTVEEPARTRSAFIRRLPWAVFALVPVMAALLRIVYRKRERYFVPHLVFALHFHTFSFVLLTLGFVYQAIVGKDHLGPFLSLWIAIAFFLALRRAYGNGRLKTLFKMFLVGFVYLFALALAMLVSFLLTGLGG